MFNTNNKLNERLALYILRSEWIISILSLYISTAADKETVWQTKLPGLVIISFILMILVKNSILLLQGEIRFWSLLQVEGLRRVYEFWLRKFSSLVPRPSMANRF